MTNKPSFSPKNALIKISTILTLIGTTDAALAQNLADNSSNKPKIENNLVNAFSLVISPTSPLGIIQTQIKQYPQELQDHYKEVLNSFYVQEEVDLVNKLLEENVFQNISDANEGGRVGLQCIEVIALEGRIKPIISRRVKTNNPINPDNRKYIINFSTGYDKGFSTLRPILEKKIAEVKNKTKANEMEIEANKKEIEINKKDIEANKKDIEANKKDIEAKKLEFIKFLKRLEKSLIEKSYSNKQDFSEIKKLIIEDSEITKIDIQKDFPNVRKKIQETKK